MSAWSDLDPEERAAVDAHLDRVGIPAASPRAAQAVAGLLADALAERMRAERRPKPAA